MSDKILFEVNKIIETLLAEGKVNKHHTYDKTGIVSGSCRKISGSAGVDVGTFYICPAEKEKEGKQIEICYNNTHYGYAHFGEDGLIYDNSNRAVFEIESNS